MAAQTVAKRPKISAALPASPPRKFSISLGRTGIIIPSASMSRTTVIKIKMTAARLGEVEVTFVLLKKAFANIEIYL
jgi:hypothetical protein